MSDPASPDPRELPRFDALRDAINGNPTKPAILAWVDKMEEWAKTAIHEIEVVEKDRDDDRDKMESLEREIIEARDATAELEHLHDRIMDVERGIITFNELYDDVRAVA